MISDSLGLEHGVHRSVGVGAELRMTTGAVVGQMVDRTGCWTRSQTGWVWVWLYVPCCLSKVKFPMTDCSLGGSSGGMTYKEALYKLSKATKMLMV